MFRLGILCFLFVAALLTSELSAEASVKKTIDKITILEQKQIRLKKYPKAFNPSLETFGDNYIFTFRHVPDIQRPWISQIGIVLLDKNFEQVSEPRILKTRSNNVDIPSQAEDARVFSVNGMLYLLYNDNVERVNPSTKERRDMYIAPLLYDYEKGIFNLGKSLKLIHETNYEKVKWQKNWVPFEWNNQMMMAYSTLPHEILRTDLTTGVCKTLYNETIANDWKWGALRGGTPGVLVDGEYLSFFHSHVVRNGGRVPCDYVYYMGAYTFSAEPPFEIRKISSRPIIADNFYVGYGMHKQVVFPSGLVVEGSKICVAYGKDDYEMWIIVFDKKSLMSSLKGTVKKN